VREAERQLEALLAARRPILILGEPGTGHDAAARALRASDAPWVALVDGARLAAGPASLLEDAGEGTLYCPEIGAYSKAEQKGLAFLLAKLERSGTGLVATSSEPLGALAAEGRFDAALLSALSAGSVLLPPLRARREDIPPLIERHWREGGTGEPLLATLPPATLATLANAHWPGNLDQLANVVSNLKLLRGDISSEHAKRLIGESAAASGGGPVAPELTARFFELPLREAREAFERIYFEQLLGREQSNMSRVADKAGLERTHLYRKLKQLNIRFSRRGDDSTPPG